MTRHRRTRIAAALIVGSFALSAGGAWATTEPIDSTVPATSEEAGSTTSSLTSTTVASTTTLEPVAADTAAVTAATVAARTARMDALIAPDDEAVQAALDEWYVAGGAAREEVDTRVQHLLDEGYRVRPDQDLPDSLTVEQVVLLDGPPATRADATACVVESSVTYQPSTPDSSEPEAVVDESYRVFRTVYSLINDDGAWKVDTASFIEEWPGETECPPPPTTTTAAPTTLDPVATEEALIAQRVMEIWAARRNAYIHLDAPGTAEALDATYVDGGEARAVVESDLTALREQGWNVRENPTTPATVTVESVTIHDDPLLPRADAVFCMIDSAIVFEPGGAPDGSDAIVNDEVTAYRSIQHLVIEDGTWQLDSVEGIAEWAGAVQCPAA